MAATLGGLPQVQKNLKEAARKYKEAIAAAQYVEAADLVRMAQAITPLATGALRASIFIKSIVNGRGGPRTKVGFSAPYAHLQHSHTSWKHRVGQALFLSTPLKTIQSGFVARVAARAKRFYETGVSISMTDIFPKVMSPRQKKSKAHRAYLKKVSERSKAKRKGR